MKVYDSFLFFNELDLLEIRLHLLDPVVDYFIISESVITFSGKEKPLYYQENKERFKKFEHKIIHQVVKDTPDDFVKLPKVENPTTKEQIALNQIYTFINAAENFPKEEKHWGRDYFQRECLRRAYVNCEDTDIIIFSDIDEIPDPETLKQIVKRFPSNEIYTFRQKEFHYFLNLYRQDNWMGPRVANYHILKQVSLNSIRAIVPGDRTLVDTVNVPRGGWHFTSLGGTEKIIQKIESWGHQEFNTKTVKENVQKKVESGGDIFFRRGMKRLERVEITEKIFPKWLVENQKKYSHLINTTYKNSFFLRIKDTIGDIFIKLKGV